MVFSEWEIVLIGQAKKMYKSPRKYLSGSAENEFIALLSELKDKGPIRRNWPNFDTLGVNKYHCHIEKGRPTYVACWRIVKKKKLIEVYYAGTHEKAPY